jgi:hypothetical protein
MFQGGKQEAAKTRRHSARTIPPSAHLDECVSPGVAVLQAVFEPQLAVAAPHKELPTGRKARFRPGSKKETERATLVYTPHTPLTIPVAPLHAPGDSVMTWRLATQFFTRLAGSIAEAMVPTVRNSTGHLDYRGSTAVGSFVVSSMTEAKPVKAALGVELDRTSRAPVMAPESPMSRTMRLICVIPFGGTE